MNMSGEEMVNLLIRNSNGKSQIIKVQKGSKLVLPVSNTKVITGIVNSNQENQSVGIVSHASQNTSLHTTVVKVRAVKSKSNTQISNSVDMSNENSVSDLENHSFSIDSVEFPSDNESEESDGNQYSLQTQINGNGLMTPSDDDDDACASQKEFLSAVLEQHVDINRKRVDVQNNQKRPHVSYGKRRRVDKSGKGLRHFSMKVCEKVRRKGTTTYNEVADELVEEFTNPSNQAFIGEQYDQKNIRRRVYDALNVLMAMNIISKERKEIKWIGLPTNSLQECINLLNDKKQRMAQVTEKMRHLYDLILHQVSYKRLVERNQKNEQVTGSMKDSCRLHIPFILVSTSKKTFVDCNISHDKTEYLMLYDDKFEIHDDVEILKRMDLVLGLDKGQCSGQNLEIAKSLVPKVLQKYVVRLARGQIEPTIEDLKELINDSEKTELSSASLSVSENGAKSKFNKNKSRQILTCTNESESASSDDDYVSY